MDEIARLARAGKPTIYCRFPSKEALFTAVVMRAMLASIERFESNVPTGASVEERLESVGATILRWILVSETIGMIRLESPRRAGFRIWQVGSIGWPANAGRKPWVDFCAKWSNPTSLANCRHSLRSTSRQQRASSETSSSCPCSSGRWAERNSGCCMRRSERTSRVALLSLLLRAGVMTSYDLTKWDTALRKPAEMAVTRSQRRPCLCGRPPAMMWAMPSQHVPPRSQGRSRRMRRATRGSRGGREQSVGL